MNKTALAGCLVVAFGVIGFLAGTGVINVAVASGAGLALLLAAGVELNRKRKGQ
ncbi:hypothetical protein ACF08N_06780 [Streptomyces sp. NPDC015127]|uniref:hypothetical protein n=1 Tax=Streptomyces sp. NPDC015127 TaxID=3364939 RepID=UPI0036F7158E